MNKEVRSLITSLQNIEGVEVAQSAGGGHFLVMKEGSFVATLPASPSDRRWRQNTLAQLRKVGITPGVRPQKKRRPPQTMRPMDARAELVPIREKRQVSQFARFMQQLAEIRGLRPFGSVESAEQSVRRVIDGHGLRDWGWVLLSAALVEWRRRPDGFDSHEAVAPVAEVTTPDVVEEEAAETEVAPGLHLVVDLSKLSARLAEFGIGLEVR